MTKPRYYFTPARQIDGWWWSFVKDATTGETVTVVVGRARRERVDQDRDGGRGMTTLEKLQQQLDDSIAALHAAQDAHTEARVRYETAIERHKRALDAYAAAVNAIKAHQL